MDTKLFCSGLSRLQPVINVKTLLTVPIQSKAVRDFRPISSRVHNGKWLQNWDGESSTFSLWKKKWVKFCSGITEQCTLFDQYRELLLWHLYLLEVRQDFCLHNYLRTTPFINTKFIFYKKKSSKDIFKAGQEALSQTSISNKHENQKSCAAQ